MRRHQTLWLHTITALLTLLAFPGLAMADGVNLAGTWKFSSSNAKAVFYQQNGMITGHFESSSGASIWEIEGQVEEDGDVSLVRFIPKSELTGNGVPDPTADAIIAALPSRKPGFLAGRVALEYDADEDKLTGYYTTHSAVWDRITLAVDEVTEKRNELILTREFEIPFSPAKTRAFFQGLEALYAALVEEMDARRQELAPLFPEEFERMVRYRLGLVRRYLRFDTLYAQGTAVPSPGIPLPGQSPSRPIKEADLYVIASVYGELIMGEVPRETGSFALRLAWNDANGSRIYFATAQEDSKLGLALTYRSIEEQRRRIRNYLTALMEGGVIGPTHFLPGGSLAMDVYILVTGKTLQGNEATVLDRIFAVGDIGLQTLPISIGVVRASMLRASRAPHPLLAELANTNQLRARLQGAGGNAIAKEMIMTQWLDDYDAVMGMRGGSLVTSRQSFTAAEGRPLPQQGIDRYAVPRTPRVGDMAVMREFKRLRDFDGEWSSASRSGLSTNNVRIPGIHSSSAEATQASWSWFVDRAIKAHRYAMETNLPRQAAASRDLLVRFVNNRLSRQAIVMTEEGAIHVSREAHLARICSEAHNPRTGATVTIDDLQRAASDYLADYPPR